MPRYFHKELLSNRLYFSNGKPVNFEAVDDHNGVYQAASDHEATDLAGYIALRRGGLTEITQTNFDELKKNAKFSNSAKSLIEQQYRIIQTGPAPEAPVDPLVQLAKEQANARAAAGQNPVAVVAVNATSPSKSVEQPKAPKPPAPKATPVKTRPMSTPPKASGA